MTPQPEETPEPGSDDAAAVLAAARKRLTAAQRKREDDHAEVDRVFWTAVRDEIASKRIRQVDAADALGYTREYIRKNLKSLPLK
ncbi:hypothetical protein ACIRPK_26560 [Kitasatospora sp. NPDC101801]|uniref:hypothetical protein n=1 Tax=Bacillati TaxID=1783272 RepID=UPI003817B051